MESFYKNCKKYILFFPVFIWLVIYFSYTFVSQAIEINNRFPELYSLSLEDKYKSLDGDYYLFIRFCQEKIPEDAHIVFINTRENQIKKYSQSWMESEYYRQKLPYYLYPRKIYVLDIIITNSLYYKIIYDPLSKEKHFKLFLGDKEIK